MPRTKTLLGIDKWYVDLERQCLEESFARVYRSLDGTLGNNETVARCENIPHIEADDEDDAEDDDNYKLDRNSQEWKNLVLLTHAPILLDAIKRVLWHLDEWCDGLLHEDRPRWTHSLETAGKIHAMLHTESNHPLWLKLCELQRELQIAADMAEDTESF